MVNMNAEIIQKMKPKVNTTKDKDSSPRYVILDTETTGISHREHKIIEIGCVEIINNKLTGREYVQRINPERDIDAGAFRVHNISFEELRDCPVFSEIKDEFLDFIKGSELVIHNATFDINFLNKELRDCDSLDISQSVKGVIDTVKLSRRLLPEERSHRLDALCNKFKIDKSSREFHGALIDARLLASVFLKLQEMSKKI